VLRAKESEKVWKTASQLLEDLSGEFDENIYQEFIQNLQKKSKIKGKKLFMPLRVALTGHTEGPELVHLFKSLGKTRISERIHRATESIQHPESN
jgi:glutamyl/glutaminyl-tRNA synthetase